MAGGFIRRFLQRGDLHRAEDLDLGAGGAAGVLAGFADQAAVGFRAQGKDIPPGNQLGKRFAADFDGAVGQVDAGHQPFQAGKALLQLLQQGGGRFGRGFALLHQDIAAQTTA